MAWSFGDSFDLYAAPTDMANGYWDSMVSGFETLTTGRFANSQGIRIASGGSFTKSSGVNDAVHHIVIAFQQTFAFSGTSIGAYCQLSDGATAQCSIGFRSDGAIVLASGGPTGTVLATYAGALAATSTWYAFEIEVVINNTTGSFTVRRNGNTVNDFFLGSLNTRGGTTNNYANKLTVGQSTTINNQIMDDLFWQSGAATGAWLGDIRCYARMPASDQSVTFSRTPTSYVQTPFTFAAATNSSALQARYSSFVPAFDGTISAGTVLINTGFTGSLKCSVFNGTATTITTVLASATTLVNPISGSNALVFPIPFAVTKGTQYWIGYETDAAYTNAYGSAAGSVGLTSATTYAAFPVANTPVTTGQASFVYSLTIPVGSNNSLVNEPQQDGLTSYVYDSNSGDADFYGVGSVASTPATVIATTTRAYMQKSDAGTRTAAVQLKSGATTVASSTLVLTTSGWLWAWRTDLTDPNTGAAWTPAAVNNAQIGPTVIA